MKTKIIKIFSLAAITFPFLVRSAYAQFEIKNPAINNYFLSRPRIFGAAKSLSLLVSALIALGLIIGIIFFLVQLLLGAIKWIQSSGDKGRLQAARDQLTHAIIGLAILLSVYVIMALISRVFDFNLFALPLPSVTN